MRILHAIAGVLGGSVIVLALAPHVPPVQKGLVEATVFGMKLKSFHALTASRDPKCSLRNCWQILFEDTVGARMAIGENIKTIRSENDSILVQTTKGPFWLLARDLSGLAEMLDDDSKNSYGALNGDVRPGDIVLDCGANIGVFTRHALRAGARLVVAIEIFPPVIDCLRKTFATEIAQGKVIVYPKGVWDKQDILRLHWSEKQSSLSNSVVFEKERQGPVVQLTTIDNIVGELNLSRVDFIKMDIEGAERRALAGAKRTLALYKPRMAVALEHRREDPEEIPALLKKLLPDRPVQCGPCRLIAGHIQPDIAFAN